MTSCCPPRPMRWNVVTGAITRGKSKSTGYARKRKSVRAWRWTCGVKPTPKAVNKPWQHCIVHGLDNPVSLLQTRNLHQIRLLVHEKFAIDVSKDTIKNVLKCLQFGWHRIRVSKSGP